MIRRSVFRGVVTFVAGAGLAACGGGNWQNEGPVAAHIAYSGKIFASNGTQYAAYVDSTTQKLTVAKFSGGNWSTVGDTMFTAFDYDFALYVDGSTPYLAAIPTSGTAQLTVLKYGGSSWAPLGGTGPAVGTSPLFLSVANGTAYLGYTDANVTFHVQSVSGTSWTDLGLPQGATTGAFNYGLGLFNGTPYVFYGSDSQGTLAQWSGSAWTTVASTTTGPSYDDSRCAGTAPSLVASSGSLYVSYFNTMYGAVVVKLSASNTLDPVGALGTISNGDTVECVSGTVYKGTPYVAFDDENRDSDPQPKAATVKVYQSGAWALYAGYPSQNDIEATQLITDQSDGHLYLTYEDDTLGGMTVEVK